MKRVFVVSIALLIALVAGAASGATMDVIRGGYNLGSSITTSVTSSTSATSVLTISTNTPSYYVNKTFIVKNPTGGTQTDFVIEISYDGTNYATLDNSSLVNVAAGALDCVAIANTVAPYWRVTGQLDLAGISTPEIYWYGSTN